MKPPLFIREQFSTSRRSTCLLAMGLDTSCPNECLVTKLRTFSRTMSVLHAKFGVKTVMNEEIPVNKWQKKKKNVKVGRNDVYSIKFWVRLKCFSFMCFLVYGTSCTSERLKESTLALLIVEIPT